MNTETTFYHIYSLTGFVFVFCYYTFLSAKSYGEIKKDNLEKGKGQRVYLIEADKKSTYFLIGKTGDYLFLYSENKEVLVKKFEDGISLQTADFSQNK